MNRLFRIIAMTAVTLTLHSCNVNLSSLSFGDSDLYTTDNRERVVAEVEAQQEYQRRMAEQRALQAQQSVGEQELNFNTILASDYQSAYARRLYGFESSSYRMPASYYSLAASEALFYASAYDPAFYNVMVSGDQVWVEPKYVTSMFGSWGATNITYGLYSSPWNYGWNFSVSPFYYSMWGYPCYSWYDWNWNICYNPWYYDPWFSPGYYPGYYPYPGHHHPYPPHHPPHHRPQPGLQPGYRPITGGGASAGRPIGNLNGGRNNAASRYTSPQSNRNYGSTTVENGGQKRSGTISSGIHRIDNNRGNNTVRNSNTSITNRDNNATTNNSNFRSGSSNRDRSTTSGSSYNSGTRSSSSRSGSMSSGGGGTFRSGGGSGGGGNRGGSRR